MVLSPIEIDCVGLRCPAPILRVSKAVKAQQDAPAVLRVTADDGDFPADLEAWCRTTKSTLANMENVDGTFVATIEINGGADAPEVSAPTETDSPRRLRPLPTVEVDCRGMRCPAPILAVSKASKAAEGAVVLVVRADDGDFPTDIEAWARSKNAVLKRCDAVDDGFLAEIQVGEPVLQLHSSAPEERLHADLRGKARPQALMALGQAVLENPEGAAFACDASMVQAVKTWAAATGALVDVNADGVGTATMATEEEVVEVADVAVATVQAPRNPDAVEKENFASLLVLHNDFESLMAAMMVASTCAAQGMRVNVFFSFWGVNMLRSTSPVNSTALTKPPGFLHKMMKWMMPAGPDNQKMGQMHMGGMGMGMMKFFMKKQSVMSLRELMDSCVDQGVTFTVCTMSMGIMGIDKADLMDLPNMEFGGVTKFTADSRVAATSLVF